MNPLISIIVPVYNAACYLERCIESIIKQTYTHLEIVLVDDGSTDESLHICKKWAKQDKRIQVIAQVNKGVSSARNAGIKNATGDYLILLDSDDWLITDTCKILLSQMKQQNADCVICGLKQTSGNIWAPAFDRFYESSATFKHDFAYWLDTELLSSSVNKIYKRTKIKELYPEDISYGEDLIFVLNYLKCCERISFIKAPLYQHEVYNSVSLTHSFEPIRFFNLEYIQQAILAFADDEGKKNIRIYDKYVRDIIRSIRMWYKKKDIPLARKNNIVRQWIRNSYMKKLKISNYSLSWKDMFILYCLKINSFTGINLVVNGKEYVKNSLKM